MEGDSPHTAHQPEPSVTEPVAEVTPEEPTAADTLESDRQRLQRLVEYVARQEPRLRWAAGKRRDGTVVLATDLAHGWIPPWVDLPAGVELLSPQRRSGGPAALLGPTEIVATYTPGDPFSGASDSDLATPSGEARQAPPVDDLGHQLAQATLRRDGLPEFVHTLAKGGAAGSDVVTVQIQILRLLLDAARHRLLAQYHQVESTDLLNCLLLAATEGIATGDSGSANYHFAWFQALSS